MVATGSPDRIARARGSATGRWLRGGAFRALAPAPSLGNGAALEVRGARWNNLCDVDARIPIGALTCVTGVSGSGKSSLVEDVLYHGLRQQVRARRRRGGTPQQAARCRELRGADAVQRVLLVDQTPIGKTPRSVPASYVGFLTPLRQLFAQLPEARARGFAPGRFSFNVADGRCPDCEGQGRRRTAMSFLPDVWVDCQRCGGERFDEATLAVRFKGHSMGDLLSMGVADARPLFADHPSIDRALTVLDELGLGYLTLGQPSPTLSGGEAQRVKLAAEMATRGRGRTCYVLDEPTTGLHMEDVARLAAVLRRLAKRGDTVVVIEHNLDLIARADWVIDLGPGPGADGGRVVAQGHPFDVAKRRRGSHTAKELAAYLREHAPAS